MKYGGDPAMLTAIVSGRSEEDRGFSERILVTGDSTRQRKYQRKKIKLLKFFVKLSRST